MDGYQGGLRAVVLDWAGTAVDFGCLGPAAVFVEVFAARGVTVPLAAARAPMGLKKIDHIRAMCLDPRVAGPWREFFGREPDQGDVTALYADVEPRMVEVARDHALPVPGLLEAVAAFRAMGLKIGSTTGYTRPMIEALAPVAAGHGYAPDAVVCATDVPEGRPAPFMCYQNALLLGVWPMWAMVKIGDTLSDVAEGRNAGMWTVAVSKTGNELGLSEAEAAALAPDDLARRLAAIKRRFSNAGAHFVIEDLGAAPAVIAEIMARMAAGERPWP